MKKNVIFIFTITVFVLLIVKPNYATGAPPDEIQGLICTSHQKGVPSKTTIVDIQWSEPLDYTGYYYTFFSKASEYTQFTFNEDSSENFPIIEDAFANYSHSGDDTSYNFYISPVWSNEFFEEEYGPTSTYGPIIIDTTPPTGSVTISPKISSTSNVTLSLTTDDAVKMRVSNIGAGDGTERDFVTSMPWELAEGNGTQYVYVQLIDVAGNTTNINDSATVSENTAPQIYKNSQQYSGSSTTISAGLSLIDVEGGLLTMSTTSENLTLIAGNTFSVKGLGWTKNANTYTIEATAGETIPLTFSYNGLSLENLFFDTIIITVTDPSNLSTTQMLNVYLKGDINGDGVVQLDDVEKAFYFNAGLYVPSEIEAYIINTVEDGQIISMDDFRGIFNLYIGL